MDWGWKQAKRDEKIMTPCQIMIFVFVVLVVWHYVEEQLRPGFNSRGINEFLGSSKHDFPVTALHEIVFHRAFVFVALLAAATLALNGRQEFAGWLVGVAMADGMQHVFIFERRVSGFWSGLGYLLWGSLWLALFGAGSLWLAIAGASAVFVNLIFLAIRLEKSGRWDSMGEAVWGSIMALVFWILVLLLFQLRLGVAQ